MELKGIAVSSRIRLARNIASIPFPSKLHDERAFSEVIKKVYDVVNEGNYSFYQMNAIDEPKAYSLVEKHLISPNLVENKNYGAVLINKDETLSIMLNEEDHIRIQVINKGFSLKESYKESQNVDNKILRSLNIAYDEQYGFLTACPTNLGTALRASIMLFLPGLTLNNQMNSVIDAVDRAGITVRGIFGEGSNTYGYMYQVSNKLTLGVSEEEIISNVENAVKQIAKAEMQAREDLLRLNENEILNMVYRAKGVLTSSYMLSTKEFYENMGELLFGVYLNIFKADDEKLIELFSNAGPGSLSSLKGEVLSPEERDLFRAKYVRERVNSALS